MPSSAKRRKAELIDAVVARVHDQPPRQSSEMAESFVRQYYGGVAPEDLAGFSSDALYGAALGLLKFAETRKPRTPRIRVYNPRHEEHGWQSTHTIIEIINDDMPFVVDSVAAALNRQDLFLPAFEARRAAGAGMGEVLTVHLLIFNRTQRP